MRIARFTTGDEPQYGVVMGEVDEYFIEQLRPGDAFVLAGEVLRFEGMSENEAFVTRATARDPVIPSYNSGKFPLSTHLAERVRTMLASEGDWGRLPESVSYWLELQRERSAIPGRDELLIETFARRNLHYLVTYPFEGRLAHQVAIDLGGRAHAVVDARVKIRKVGDLQADLLTDFFEGFARGARANVHLKVLYGRSDHHKVEALFKAFGRALRMACSRDRRLAKVMPSTKGLL